MGDERVTGGHSMHTEEKEMPPHSHYWRVVECDGKKDICECSVCGRQQQFSCNFDDEYS